MTDFKKTTIEADREKLDAFKELFPQQGSIKWFIDSSLEAVIRLSKEKGIPKIIDDIFKEAAEEAVKRMGEGGDTRG